jgi:hypothetical protein
MSSALAQLMAHAIQPLYPLLTQIFVLKPTDYVFDASTSLSIVMNEDGEMEWNVKMNDVGDRELVSLQEVKETNIRVSSNHHLSSLCKWLESTSAMCSYTWLEITFHC